MFQYHYHMNVYTNLIVPRERPKLPVHEHGVYLSEEEDQDPNHDMAEMGMGCRYFSRTWRNHKNHTGSGKVWRGNVINVPPNYKKNFLVPT